MGMEKQLDRSKILKLIIVLFVFIITGCKSTSEMVYKSSNFEIEFGNSGGFTNMPMDYYITNDGAIFKKIDENFNYVKTISNKQLNDFKKLFKRKDFRKLSINEPGNMTYFLKVKSKKYENNIQWNEQSVADEANLIYNQLISILKQ